MRVPLSFDQWFKLFTRRQLVSLATILTTITSVADVVVASTRDEKVE